MDARNSFLAIALYLIAGAAILVGVIVAVAIYQRPRPDPLAGLIVDDSETSSRIAKKAPTRVDLGESAFDPVLANAEAQLAATKMVLQEKTAELQEKSEEIERLRADYDRSMELVESLLQEPPEPNDPDVEVDDNSAQLDELRAELRRTRSREDDLVSERVRLMDELNMLETRISELEDAAGDEFLASLRSEARGAAADAALVRIGASAVPVLIEAIASRDPEVRLWAVGLLGDIGADASDALPMIGELRNDRDQRVRDAALRAQMQITR